MGLGRGEGDVLLGGGGERCDLSPRAAAARTRCWRAGATAAWPPAPGPVCTRHGAHNADLGAAGADVLGVKRLHVGHADARQRLCGGAARRRGGCRTRPRFKRVVAATVAGRVSDSLMLALQRARSRGHTSAGKLGSPIWRAARRAALSSSGGSVSERSVNTAALSLSAATSKLAPRSAQASPRPFSSSAGSALLVSRPAFTPLLAMAWPRRWPGQTGPPGRGGASVKVDLHVHHGDDLGFQPGTPWRRCPPSSAGWAAAPRQNVNKKRLAALSKARAAIFLIVIMGE